MEEKKKKVDGMNSAVQKTSLNLKVANNGSVVWSTQKTKNTHTENVSAKTQNLWLMLFAGFLNNTNIPNPACCKDIKMNTIRLKSITYLYLRVLYKWGYPLDSSKYNI